MWLVGSRLFCGSTGLGWLDRYNMLMCSILNLSLLRYVCQRCTLAVAPQVHEDINAHLKFTVYGRIYTHTSVQCSAASVGLAQACPNEICDHAYFEGWKLGGHGPPDPTGATPMLFIYPPPMHLYVITHRSALCHENFQIRMKAVVVKIYGTVAITCINFCIRCWSDLQPKSIWSWNFCLLAILYTVNFFFIKFMSWMAWV